MGEAELVLQNRLAIDQRLDFVGEGVEGLGQSLGKVCVGHPIDRSGGDVGEGSHWSGVGASMTAELGKLGLWGSLGWCVARRRKGGKHWSAIFSPTWSSSDATHPLSGPSVWPVPGPGGIGADKGSLFHHTCTRFPGQDGWRTAGRCRYSMAVMMMFLFRHALASRFCL